MRIVGGEFRGRRLVAPANSATRPTSDRAREALFNKLQHAHGDPVRDARVLDLFAGTGALGLEALSRGARFCLFVDIDADARANIRENIEALALQGRTKIFRRDGTRLGGIGTMAPFDLVFIDPPYNKGLAERALGSLRDGGWLNSGALCVVEEDAGARFAPPMGFRSADQMKQGNSALYLLMRETDL